MSILTDSFVFHGKPPYTLMFLHGGPGAGGELAHLAEDISQIKGVIEPHLYSLSIKAQIDYLRDVIASIGQRKVLLLGHSWGAWLGIILAAACPQYISKLILVSCPPFCQTEANGIADIRLGRLNTEQRSRLTALNQLLAEADNTAVADEAMAEVGKLFLQADTYSSLNLPDTAAECSYQTYKSVWQEALSLRQGNKFEGYLALLECPVIAIHGDYDPHPAKPVFEYLVNNLTEFSPVLLRRCGHCPWHETYAREEFIALLKEEIRYHSNTEN
jgi:pimeloyl-ACP methyl ester carboxylesterase